MDVGDWFRKKREDLGLRQQDLSAESGVSMATIRAVENGTRKVNRTTIRSLALAIKSDPDAVEAFTLGRLSYKEFQKLAVERSSPDGRRKSEVPHSFRIDLEGGTPILGEVTAGGMVESIVFDDGEEPERVPIVCPNLDRVYAVRVRGDSMVTEYLPGDVLMVQDVRPHEIVEGDDVVIQCDGGMNGVSTFKRIFFLDKDRIRLVPLNRAYEPSECRMSHVIRVGKVFGVYRSKVGKRKG